MPSFVMADNNLILCHFRSFAHPLGRAQAREDGGEETEARKADRVERPVKAGREDRSLF